MSIDRREIQEMMKYFIGNRAKQNEHRQERDTGDDEATLLMTKYILLLILFK